MLLGTFQEVPRNSKGEVVNIDSIESHYNECFGFRPVWCFPMTSLESCMFHAMTVAPNFPEMLLIIETDDFVRIDRVAHYQNVMSNHCTDNDLFNCVNDSVDDIHSEIIVDRNIVQKCVKAAIYLPMLRDLAMGNISIKKLSPIFDNAPAEFQNTVIDMLEKTPVFSSEYNESITGFGNISNSREYWDARMKLDNCKFMLNCVLLPVMYKCLTESTGSSIWLQSYYHNRFKFLDIINEFAHWSYDDCSYDTYDSLYDKFSKLSVTNVAILFNLASGDKVYPNEPCPCGSGNKFKKCCGRYL